MKIKPGIEFVVKGIRYSVVRRSAIAGHWLIKETYNDRAELLLRDENWINFNRTKLGNK